MQTNPPYHSALFALRKHQKLQAMTLVEIMIVIAIMALITTGVGVAVVPLFLKSKEEITATRASAIRNAATLWLTDNPSGGCPTVEELIEDKKLEKNKDSNDGWNNEFAIECEDGEIQVISAGKDGEFGTDDDVS